MFKRYKPWFLLLLLLLFLIVIIFFTGNYVIVLSSASNELSNLLLGALIVFLFGGVTFLIGKVVNRSVQHYNSLITLGTQLNEMIGVIKDNLYLLPNFKIALLTGNIYFSKLRPLVIDKTHLINLYDIDLINEVFEFYIDARKMNDDIESLHDGYEDIKNAYIQKNINVESYVTNGKEITKQLELLELGYEDLLEKIINLLTRIRIQIERDKPLTSVLLEHLIFTSGKNITITEFKKEKIKLEKELEESSEKSRKEKDKIFKSKK